MPSAVPGRRYKPASVGAVASNVESKRNARPEPLESVPLPYQRLLWTCLALRRQAPSGRKPAECQGRFMDLKTIWPVCPPSVYKTWHFQRGGTEQEITDEPSPGCWQSDPVDGRRRSRNAHLYSQRPAFRSSRSSPADGGGAATRLRRSAAFSFCWPGQSTCGAQGAHRSARGWNSHRPSSRRPRSASECRPIPSRFTGRVMA
jgi:hypothetical protein